MASEWADNIAAGWLHRCGDPRWGPGEQTDRLAALLDEARALGFRDGVEASSKRCDEAALEYANAGYPWVASGYVGAAQDVRALTPPQEPQR